MSWEKKAISFVFICIISCFLSMVALASPPVMEGWKQNDTGWWYRKSDGTYPSTSWKNINNKWYYFDDNGYMVEDSWVSNYYVGNDGAMLVSTVTPDGYHVLESGERVEDTIKENQNEITESVENSNQSEIVPGIENSDNIKNEEQNLSGDLGAVNLNAQNEITEENIGPVASYTKGNEVGPGEENKFDELATGVDKNKSDKVSTDVDDNRSNEIGQGANSKNEIGPGNEENNVGPFDNNTNEVGSSKDNTNNEVGPGTDNVTTDINDQSVTGPTALIPNDTTTETPNSRVDIVDELQSYGLSEEEANLYYLINEYRESLGLSKLSFSKSLTKVARAHVKDSHDYTPRLQLDSRGVQGNLHSWSKHGNWSGGAYTPDHEYAEIMWDKPRELTSYQGSGYEISVYYSLGIDPQLALDLWRGSRPHNNVIIGDNDWSFITTMGVAIDENYSHVWFGGDEDPEGYYDIDGYEVVHP